MEPSHRIHLNDLIEGLEVIMTNFPQYNAVSAEASLTVMAQTTRTTTSSRNHALAHLKLKYINEGTFGMVFMASLGNQIVAVKYYKQHHRNTRSNHIVSNGFYKEFTLLNLLRQNAKDTTRDSHILWPLSPLPDTITPNLPAQMVFHFANGRDLHFQLKAVHQGHRDSFSNMEVLNVFEGLLEALQTLRGSRLVHGDIKPDSMTHTHTHKSYDMLIAFGSSADILVFMNEESNAISKVMLSDLGLSFSSGQNMVRTQVTGYWAPEMKHADVVVGTAADVYAVGTVMMNVLLSHTNLLRSVHRIARYQDQYQLTPEPVLALFARNANSMIQQEIMMNLVLPCWELRIKNRPLPHVLLIQIKEMRSKAMR